MSDALRDLEIDIDEGAAGGTAAPRPAANPGVDLDESRPGDEEAKLPDGAELLDGAETYGGAAVRYTLHMPVKLKVMNRQGVVAEERFETLTLHRLTAADMDAAMNSGRDNMRVLILRSTRLPITRASKVYEKLDGADIGALAEIVNFLLRPGRKTGR